MESLEEDSIIEQLRVTPERVFVDPNSGKQRHLGVVNGRLHWATFVQEGNELVLKGEQGYFGRNTPRNQLTGILSGFMEV